MDVRARLFTGLQYLVPQHLLSRMAGWLANTSIHWIKDPFTRWFVRQYGVNMAEALESDPCAYQTFNDFFTRALKPGARALCEDTDAVLSPADGTISQIGDIRHDTLVQAKGHHYTVTELLGGDETTASWFADGSFAVVYLSPRDYHRVHMPLPGKLLSMTHVPGDLFSVNDTTAANVPGLFARNERAICVFETEAGPMVVILVGAMIVASIELAFHGQVTPAPRTVQTIRYSDVEEIRLERGEELGRFKLGSTAIVLLPKEASRWQSELCPGASVQMGSKLGTLNTNPVSDG